MKFIFADALDQIDPGYNFLTDENTPGRKAYWDDQYPHEFFDRPPYDGVLISRGIVGDSRRKGKYTDAQAMRLRREGAREFLRLDRDKHKNLSVFGDCGAFSYVAEKVPPYSADDMAEFYEDGQFSHGCSVDHIIFGFRPENKDLDGAEGDEKERFDITQENARQFLERTRQSKSFTPLGVVQGWSPDSMAIAAQNLEKMGYDYLAVGGMVPLDAPQIHLALQAIRDRLKPSTRLHILGFAKAEQIKDFNGYGIASFDSTSPLIRAFKDAKSNYYVGKESDGLDYYTAIRIPLALENLKLTRAVKEGRLDQDELAQREAKALHLLRLFDQGQARVEDVVYEVLKYQRLFLSVDYKTEVALDKAMSKVEKNLLRTLTDRPWQACQCKVCASVGIEVAIFRSSNRNRRRGFHNLQVYYQHLQRIIHGK
ncbi:tRNA-guanine transglycosylase DpdA [Pseudogulbenkiania sp. MAI-1]|uniref:tRNA-guanine transglycosylase DpdA n=1 Tax=Pseudogulbenkiania sp. MAI-1 TaxID=990370 RepID=UPI00045E7F5E|nr:tRNA-guanine transglycosylase DpdA [Pseudogulbenkiania sp. MAI-1]